MSFRKYGGIYHSATNNIVKSHYSTSDNQIITNTVGQQNSKIVNKSHLDLDKQSILNTQSIYFTDNTIQNTAYPGTSGGNLEVGSNLIVNGSTTLNGISTTLTQVNGNNSTTIATTAFVQNAVQNVVDSIMRDYSTTIDISGKITTALSRINLPDYAKLNADVSFNKIQFKAGPPQDEPFLPINILSTLKSDSTFTPPTDNNWLEYQYPSNIKINKFGQIMSIKNNNFSSSDLAYDGWTVTDRVISTRSNLMIGSDNNTDKNMPSSISTQHTYATLFNTDVQNLEIGGSTSVIEMGAGRTKTTIYGESLIVPKTISTSELESFLFNTDTTTINIGGQATNINMGAPIGKTKINGSLCVINDASFGTINLNNGNFKVDGSGNTTIDGILDFSKLKIKNSINSGLIHVDSSGNITVSKISTMDSSDGQNTIVGFNALKSNKLELIISDKQTNIWNGYSNSAFGYESLNTNTSGSYNTAMGYQSLYNNTSGYNNTAIGTHADVSGVELINATAIGAYAMVDSSNCIQLGNPNVTKINTSGIIYTKSGLNINNSNFSVDSTGNTQTRGTFAVRNEDASFNQKYGTNNAFYVDTSGNTQITGTLSVKGDASFNKIYGGKNGEFNVDASGNVTALNLVTLTGMNTALGPYVTTTAQTAALTAALGPYVTTTAQTAALNTALISYVTTTAQTTALTSYVSKSGNSIIVGNLTASGFNTSSDYRVKENVQQLDTTLFNVDKLNPVIYNKIESGKQDIGFIAHEVQEVFPCLVTGKKDGEQTQSLNYLGLIGVLVKEIQELKKRVAILENR